MFLEFGWSSSANMMFYAITQWLIFHAIGTEPQDEFVDSAHAIIRG